MKFTIKSAFIVITIAAVITAIISFTIKARIDMSTPRYAPCVVKFEGKEVDAIAFLYWDYFNGQHVDFEYHVKGHQNRNKWVVWYVVPEELPKNLEGHIRVPKEELDDWWYAGKTHTIVRWK